MTATGYDVGTLALLGGHVALDFVNTIEDRTSPRPDDTLRAPADLVRFGVRHELVSDAVRRATRAELADALALRSALLDVLAAQVDGSRAPSPALETLRHEVERAWAAAEIGGSTRLVPHWPQTRAETVRHRVAVASAELLGSAEASRIRRCGNHDCGWYFLDASKNGSRRWCSMRGCGTVAKSRRRRRPSTKA